MNEKLNELFYKIRNECFGLIAEKKVDIEDLSFSMGMPRKDLYDLFEERNEDFSLYLKIYDLLVNW